MLPNVSSIEDTKKQIVYYALILILSSYLPYLDSNVGTIYLAIVSILNLLLFNSSLKLKKSKEKKSIPNTEGLKFFALTIFYLFSLFAGLLIDHVIM
jgi:protoheme IX farnesyltransferase